MPMRKDGVEWQTVFKTDKSKINKLLKMGFVNKGATNPKFPDIYRFEKQHDLEKMDKDRKKRDKEFSKYIKGNEMLSQYADLYGVENMNIKEYKPKFEESVYSIHRAYDIVSKRIKESSKELKELSYDINRCSECTHYSKGKCKVSKQVIKTHGTGSLREWVNNPKDSNECNYFEDNSKSRG